MKILIACECSGKVREAFRRKGHDVWSCDILPSDIPGQHFKCDVAEILYRYDWDMVIAFPPCTDLAVSGARYFKAKQADGRQQKSIAFFMQFVEWYKQAKLERIKQERDSVKLCIENPICIMSRLYQKPTQIIQPHQFGHDASKSTCLWLHNLRELVPTKKVKGRKVLLPSGKIVERWANQTDSGQNRLGPSEKRAALRAETYQGVADAMADQWG